MRNVFLKREVVHGNHLIDSNSGLITNDPHKLENCRATKSRKK
jgi:hypothetical protein